MGYRRLVTDHGADDGTGSSQTWLMLGGVWVVYAVFGLAIGSTAAFVPAMRADLDLTRSQLGVILGMWQFVYLGASIPGGKLIDRIGLRWSLMLAAVLTALSVGLRAAAVGFWSLLVAVAILGLGGPLISIGAPKMVASTFSAVARRKAVGIYATGPAIGSAVGLAASNGLVRPLLDDSWRASVALYAVITLLAGLFWLAVSRPLTTGEQVAMAGRGGRELLALPIVRLVLVIAIGAFFYSHSLSNWLVEILEAEGWSSTAAGYWAAFPPLLGIAVTLALPTLATPRRRMAILSAAMAIGGVGILFIQANGSLVLTLALAAAAIARVSVMPICMLILMDHEDVGPQNMAAVGGLFFTAAELGGVLGPSVTGILADATDGFAVPIVMWSTVLFLMSLLAALAFRRHSAP